MNTITLCKEASKLAVCLWYTKVGFVGRDMKEITKGFRFLLAANSALARAKHQILAMMT
jgi:hypothetical protein